LKDTKEPKELSAAPDMLSLDAPTAEAGEGNINKDKANDDEDFNLRNELDEQSDDTESEETGNYENMNLGNDGNEDNSGVTDNDEVDEDNWTRVTSNQESRRVIRPPARLIEEMKLQSRITTLCLRMAMTAMSMKSLHLLELDWEVGLM
jgi:hypothetical protein